MSFLIPCPNCGERSVYEFRFGGEIRPPVPGNTTEEEKLPNNYDRLNAAGEQSEWWYHRLGCRQWFQAVRNTLTNQVVRTFFVEKQNPPD